MARPLWSGTIQISLVGFAVEIFPATSTTRPISFHEIDRNTLGRVRRENVSAGPRAETDGEDSGAPEEAENASAQHNSSLHIAPPARENVASREIQQAPIQHTVEKADIVKGY